MALPRDETENVRRAVDGLVCGFYGIGECETIGDALSAAQPEIERMCEALLPAQAVLNEQEGDKLTEGATLVLRMLGEHCEGLAAILSDIGAELRRMVMQKGTGPAHPLAHYREHGSDTDDGS